MAVKSKKQKTTIHTIRKTLKQDNSPSWDGSEDWTDSEFKMKFYESMQYYNTLLDKKQCKQIVINWLSTLDNTQSTIIKFKKVKDWRCNSTLGGVASCLLKGMPSDRIGVISPQDTSAWLLNRVHEIIEDSKDDVSDESTDLVSKSIPKVDKNEEIITNVISEIDGIIDGFYSKSTFTPKNINYEAIFLEYGVKPCHIGAIKHNYACIMEDLKSVIDKTCDDQLKEAYNDYPIKSVRKIYELYTDLYIECDKLVESASIKKPRAKKPVSKEKLVEKLKFKDVDDKLKLNSIDPTAIIGASLLYCYDTKTRKLYKYTALNKNGLSVKGNSIDNYDEKQSIGKMLQKPVDQLAKFKNSGKLALEKFLDDIDALAIKANPKLTDTQILLKIL